MLFCYCVGSKQYSVYVIMFYYLKYKNNNIKTKKL